METVINAALVTVGIIAVLVAVPIAVMCAVTAVAALAVLFLRAVELFAEFGSWLRGMW